MPPGHRADEQVAAPFGKKLARVERHAGRRDRRHPVVDRLLDAGHRRAAVADRHVRAPVGLARVVLHAVGDVRPAVVPARAHDVDLVAALGPVVDDPKLARLGMDRGAFGVLEAVRERLARDRGAAEPRIVRRNRAVGIDAHDAAAEVAADVGVVREIVVDAVEVRIVEAERVGAGDEHRAVGREGDAPLHARLGDHLDVLETAIVLAQPAAADALGADVEHAALGERLRPDVLVEVLDRPLPGFLALGRREIGEIDEPVGGEVRIEHDVVEALRGDDLDRRDARDRRGHLAVRRHGAQRSGALGDERGSRRRAGTRAPTGSSARR